MLERLDAPVGDQVPIPLAFYRGGTSRGLFFHKHHLPQDEALRDRCFLALMGSPDVRQINGLGGATSHTSKIAVISSSEHPEAHVDYLFGQVAIEEALVDYSGMCGNLVAAVGYFALDEGLVEPSEPTTAVRVHNVNTGKLFCIHVPVREGQTASQGDYVIDGVPGTGAYVRVDFLEPAGSVSGKLLPTGRAREEIKVPGVGAVEVSLVDVTNPIAFVRAEDLGLKGTELPAELNADAKLLERLEAIRARLSCLCGWAKTPEEAAKVAPARPRIALVSPPASYTTLAGSLVEPEAMDICSRVVSMQKVHQSYAVTAAIGLAAAARIEGCLVQECVARKDATSKEGAAILRIGHPSGVIEAETEACEESPGGAEPIAFRRGSVGRTVRLLMKGVGYVPKSLLGP